jgi:uncharacterized OsmC-like protein
MLNYSVKARRVDDRGSFATTKAAEIVLDTSLAGRVDAFNPAELFLASIGACMIKGIERVAPLLKFDFREVEVKLRATRQDTPPKLVSIDYEIIVDTDEDDRRLELLHSNVRKYGTISNTVSAATKLAGTLRRKLPPTLADVEEHQVEIERVAAFTRIQLDAVPAPGADVLHEGP